MLRARKQIIYEGKTLKAGDRLTPEPGPDLSRKLVEGGFAYLADSPPKAASSKRPRGTATGPDKPEPLPDDDRQVVDETKAEAHRQALASAGTSSDKE